MEGTSVLVILYLRPMKAYLMLFDAHSFEKNRFLHLQEQEQTMLLPEKHSKCEVFLITTANTVTKVVLGWIPVSSIYQV